MALSCEATAGPCRHFLFKYDDALRLICFSNFVLNCPSFLFLPLEDPEPASGPIFPPPYPLGAGSVCLGLKIFYRSPLSPAWLQPPPIRAGAPYRRSWNQLTFFILEVGYALTFYPPYIRMPLTTFFFSPFFFFFACTPLLQTWKHSCVDIVSGATPSHQLPFFPIPGFFLCC